MPRTSHTYSNLTTEAILLLSQQIKHARKSRHMSEHELANRAGIARSTLQKIEQGNPTINIGLVFEAAIVAGVQLFEAEGGPALASHIDRMKDKLALLPQSVRPRRREIKDDF